MGERALRTLLEGGAYFEGPRWHEGRWWVSDFYRYGVFAVDTDGIEERVLDVEGQPSGLGWMPDGSLLAVSMREHRLQRRGRDGEVTVHADLTEHCGGHLNDLVVDASGRGYAGKLRLRSHEPRRAREHAPAASRSGRGGDRRRRRPVVSETRWWSTAMS